jgi:hypothetical protein
MAIQFTAGITEAYIVNNAQNALVQLRDALDRVNDFYLWLSAYAATDLEAAPISMDSVSAGNLLSAFADAHALYQIYTTGQAPGAYPQVTGTPYVYAASQRIVIGPLS